MAMVVVWDGLLFQAKPAGCSLEHEFDDIAARVGAMREYTRSAIHGLLEYQQGVV
jgi:hypothetical protein